MTPQNTAPANLPRLQSRRAGEHHPRPARRALRPLRAPERAASDECAVWLVFGEDTRSNLK